MPIHIESMQSSRHEQIFRGYRTLAIVIPKFVAKSPRRIDERLQDLNGGAVKYVISKLYQCSGVEFLHTLIDQSSQLLTIQKRSRPQ